MPHFKNSQALKRELSPYAPLTEKYIIKKHPNSTKEKKCNTFLIGGAEENRTPYLLGASEAL